MKPLPLLAAAVAMGAVALGAGGMPSAQELNLDEVFHCQATDAAGTAACGEARDLILNNCTVCHTFVPIVMQSFDANGWTSLIERHVKGGRVNQLSTEQVAAIQAYLTENFDGSLPPPELPPELLSTWTSY